MFEEGTFSDITISIPGTANGDPGQELELHRNVLAHSCEYFRGMLTSPCREADFDAVIAIKETTPAAFRALLTYLYTDELALDDATVIDVLRKAQEFDLTRAYNMCMRYCVKCVSPSNAVGWLIRAELCHLDELRGVVLGYVKRKFRTIRDEAAASLAELRAHPDLMLEVMVHAI